MASRSVLGRQWGQPRTSEDLAAQAARVAANNACAFRFPSVSMRQLRLEKARADADTE